MTLNVTIALDGAVMQIADHRTTVDGEIITRPQSKTAIYVGQHVRALIGFSGLSHVFRGDGQVYYGKRMASLAYMPERDPTSVSDLERWTGEFCANATNEWAAKLRSYGESHTFVVAGMLLANDDCKTFLFQAELKHGDRGFHLAGDPVILAPKQTIVSVIGFGPILDHALTKRRLKRISDTVSTAGRDVRAIALAAASYIERAARMEVSMNTISPESTMVSLDKTSGIILPTRGSVMASPAFRMVDGMSVAMPVHPSIDQPARIVLPPLHRPSPPAST